MSDHPLKQIVEIAATFAAPIAPSVIGATVASLIKPDLTWTERALQIFVGSCASWYTLVGISAVWTTDPRVGQAIAFTAGLIAAEALPRIRERLIARLVEVPDLIADFILRFRGSGK